jgi:FkbM family methyltransferase
MKMHKAGKYSVIGFNPEETQILVKEVFEEEIYKIDQLHKPAVIIDCGAYTGLSTLWFREKYPDVKVVSIEPNWMSYDFMQENISLNNVRKVTLLNVGVDAESGARELFFENSPKGWNSVASFTEGGWRTDPNHQLKQSSMKVKVVTLSSILDGIKQDVDMIKMDIEGVEQAVLEEVGDKLYKVKSLAIEYHPVEGQSIGEISKLLESYDYNIRIVEDKDKLASQGDGNLAMIYATR